MEVLIVSTNRNPVPMPVMPYGACMVAESAAAAGHRVRFLDLMFERQPAEALGRELLAHPPRVVGFSVRNIDNNHLDDPVYFLDTLPDLAAVVRRDSKAVLVLGGGAVQVMPQEILRLTAADLAVVGDGEAIFPLVLERLAAGRSAHDLPGVAAPGEGSRRVNQPAREGFALGAPVPDYRLWLGPDRYRRRMATAPLQSKVGCSFHCVYCTYRRIEGGAFRFYRPASVAEGARRLAAAGFRDIEFVDSVFNIPQDHALAVCEELERARIPARFQSLELNPLGVNDRFLASLERAGFRAIGITAESASDRVLERLRKGFTAAEVQASAAAVKRSSLPCIWIFMLGGPGETESTVRETLHFAQAAVGPRDAAFFNVGVRIYPGTELEQIARTEGLLHKPAAEMLEPVFYFSPELERERLRRLLDEAKARTMNFMDSRSFSFPYLAGIQRLLHLAGVRSPAWRYTRPIRRCLRFAGLEA